MDNRIVGPAYYTELEPDQEMALMFIVSVGMNTTNALKNAAAIDAEPAYIFHGNVIETCLSSFIY
jgi:hypothetical protein